MTINEHSSIKLTGSVNIYFDPFNIKNPEHDGDFVFITHPHYDHFSPEDIKKVMNAGTVFVAPASMEEEFNSLSLDNEVIFMKPGEEICPGEIVVESIPAYNINKPYHPKEKEWLGFVVQIDGTTYYVCGDTDNIPEGKDVCCDVVLVPVGGTYTMTPPEAAAFVKEIDPSVAIPTHYGTVVGTPDMGQKFIKLLNIISDDIEGREIRCNSEADS